MKKAILSLIFFSSFIGTIQAQEDFESIQTGAANFLTIPTTARSAAMGGTSVAITNNDHAIFNNGATVLMDEIYNGGISYSFTPWMHNYKSGYSLHSIGGFYRINKRNAILAGSRYYNYPKVIYEMPGGTTTKKIYPKEFTVELGYAREIITDLAVSAIFKYIHSNMGNIGNAKSSNAIAFDVSMFYKKNIQTLQHANWAIGLQFANIGSKIKYLDTKESIPTLAKIGGSVYLPFSTIHKLMVTTDIGYRFIPADVRAINISIGGEYTVLQHFVFRGGYHYGDKNKADDSYATVGLGLKCQGIYFDFSWLFAQNDSPLKNMFWTSLGYSF